MSTKIFTGPNIGKNVRTAYTTNAEKCLLDLKMTFEGLYNTSNRHSKIPLFGIFLYLCDYIHKTRSLKHITPDSQVSVIFFH